MSTSAAQIEANRANSQKSTGPVTTAGKAVSSKNATSHGLSAKEIFVRPGEETDYLSLEEELTALYDPQNEAEGVFFKILIHSAWNLRRCRHLDASLQFEANQRGIADALLDPELARIAERIARHLRAAERSHSKALAELRKLQTERQYREDVEEYRDSSVAADCKSVNTTIGNQAKCYQQRETLRIRTRFGPGMPAFVDNGDGTFDAYTEDGKSTVRFTDSLIVDVRANEAISGKSNAAAA